MINESVEYRKRIEKELILDMDLDDITTYVKDTINYLKSDNKEKYDVSDIIAYLSSIPEIVEEIKELVLEMENRLNEQL